MTRVALKTRRDATDRAIVAATQGGLPLRKRPYEAIAKSVGIPEAEVMQRLRAMEENGVIRRIGAVPNHYALGYRGNGMSVWDVRDDMVEEMGCRVGAFAFVSHCYQRPRHLPDWPYNLFAMVHGKSKDEVDAKVRRIEALLGDACRAHDLLYSTRILKKTGLRLAAKEAAKETTPCSG